MSAFFWLSRPELTLRLKRANRALRLMRALEVVWHALFLQQIGSIQIQKRPAMLSAIFDGACCLSYAIDVAEFLVFPCSILAVC
jgi:hypothetical protein